jgi:hypothetical protein
LRLPTFLRAYPMTIPKGSSLPACHIYIAQVGYLIGSVGLVSYHQPPLRRPTLRRLLGMEGGVLRLHFLYQLLDPIKNRLVGDRG